MPTRLDRNGQNIGIGEILAGLAAGVASAYSPAAGRGINALGNVLEATRRNREHVRLQDEIKEERRLEAEELAGQKRIKADIEARTIDFLNKNTEYGEPGQPFRPPAAGLGRGIPEQQAEALKLETIARGAGPAIDGAASILNQRATRERRLSFDEARKLGEPWPGETFSVPTEEGINYSRSGLKPPKETEPKYIDWGYGRKKKIYPDGREEIVPVPVAPREPKETPESKKLTRLQSENLRDEIANHQFKLEEIRSHNDVSKDQLTEEQLTAQMRPYVASINRKYKMLGDPTRLRIEPMAGIETRTKKGDLVKYEVVPANSARSSGTSPLKSRTAAEAEADEYLARRGVPERY